MSASVRIRSPKLCHQRQPRRPQPRIVGHDEHVVEEPIDHRLASAAISVKRLPVIAPRRRGRSTRGAPGARVALEQRLSPPARSATARVRVVPRGAPGDVLARDVLDALERPPAPGSRPTCAAPAALPRPRRAQRHDVDGRRRSMRRARRRPVEAALLERVPHALEPRTSRGIARPRRRPTPTRACAASVSERAQRDSRRCRSAPAGPSGCARRRASAGAARTDRAIRSAFSPAREQPDDRIELVGQRHRRPGDRRGPELRRATAARRPRRRSAGSGDRSPSTPPPAALPRARRCRPSCPAAR